MELVDEIFYGSDGIARATIKSNSGNIYYVCIDKSENRAWCTCPYNVFNKVPCKHIIFALNKVEFSKMVNKNFDVLKTGSEVIDELFGGGLPYGVVSGIYGKAMTGKSMFGYQVGLSNIKNGGKTLYIDTEGIREQDIRKLLYKFGERWDLTKGEIDKNFIIKSTLGHPQYNSLQTLFMFFGEVLMIDQSDKGKLTVNFRTKKSTPLIKPESLEKFSMIILDSLTNPLKTTIGSNTSNLPARAQVEERLYAIFSHLATRYNMSIPIIHHASCNPVSLFGVDFGNMWGGDTILYNTKYAIQFWSATSKIQKETKWGNEARRVRLFRNPYKKATGEWKVVRLKEDYGFCDE